MEDLAHHPYVLAAAKRFVQQRTQLADLVVQVQQIAAPTDAERTRAAWVERYFGQLGLADVPTTMSTPASPVAALARR